MLCIKIKSTNGCSSHLQLNYDAKVECKRITIPTFSSSSYGSITFSFAPKLVLFFYYITDTSQYSGDSITIDNGNGFMGVDMTKLTTSDKKCRFCYCDVQYAKKSSDGKTLYFKSYYNDSSTWNNYFRSGNPIFYIAL